MANSSNWIEYPSTALYISDNYDSTSSTKDTFISLGGDTLKICTQRTPTSSGNGFTGEICFDNNYLYYCYATNQWGRIALSKSW